MTADTNLLGDDFFCAVCKKYIQIENKALPFNNRSEGPYFCSEACVESAYSFRLPPEPTIELKPGYYTFPDGMEYHTSSREARRLIPQMQAEIRSKYNADLATAQRRRTMSMEFFVKNYQRAQVQKKSDKEAAENTAYLEDFYKRSAKEREEKEKQRLADERAAAKEEERRTRDEEREAQKLQRQEERDAEREFREDEKMRLKEEDQLRKEEAEQERLRPIPFEMPSDHTRYESVHILGPQGSGKTHVLQEFIKRDVARTDSPGLVIIDPKGTMIDRLKALHMIDEDRLVIIDATHKYPAKLGLFVKSDVPGVDPEQVIGQAVSMYKYIFQTTNFAFTPKQGILFEHLVRFMFEIGGTLSTLIDFLRIEYKKPKQRDLEQIAKYAPLIDKLPKETRDFFQIDLQDSYDSTAREIGVRLQIIQQKPILRAMFDTTERRVDLSDCMQKQKIVLVNTGMRKDKAASQMIGRFIIAQVINATFIRGDLPVSQWRPNFLIVDEFQEFVDAEKTPELLRLGREYNVGVMIAHHNMYDQGIDDGIRAAISTLTGTKYCGDVRGMDLSYMVRDFGCDASFFRHQQVTETHVRFAHVMRRVHDTPVSITVRRGNLEGLDKRTEHELYSLDNINTLRVYGERFTTPPPAAQQVESPVRPKNPDDGKFGY